MHGGSSVRGIVVIYRFSEVVGVGESAWFASCDGCGLLRGLEGSMQSVCVFCRGEEGHVGGDGCVRGE